MIIGLLSRTRLKTETLHTGLLACQRCRSKQASSHIRTVSTTYLAGYIPIGAEIPRADVIVCHTCNDAVSPESYVFNPATKEFDVVLWDCPYCKHLNPNTTFKCRMCHRSLI